MRSVRTTADALTEDGHTGGLIASTMRWKPTYLASLLDSPPAGISGGCVESDPTTIAGPKPAASHPTVDTGGGGATGGSAEATFSPSLAALAEMAAAFPCMSIVRMGRQRKDAIQM